MIPGKLSGAALPCTLQEGDAEGAEERSRQAWQECYFALALLERVVEVAPAQVRSSDLLALPCLHPSHSSISRAKGYWLHGGTPDAHHRDSALPSVSAAADTMGLRRRR